MTKTLKQQPVSEFDAGEARGMAEAMQHMDGPLLPILHALNGKFGYVDERAIPIIADVLNLSRAEVHGVASFYHDFRRQPAGRHVLKICRAEACQSMGAMQLISGLEKSLGVKLGETGADGQITLEAVYCLGNCALAPAALIDGKLFGRLDAEKAARQVRK